jgi:hypothetical protein
MARKIKTFETFVTDITLGGNMSSGPDVVDLDYFGGTDEIEKDDDEKGMVNQGKKPLNRTGRDDGPKNKFRKSPIRISPA